MTASLQPGASTIIYGALAGPVLQMNILDVFLGKSLMVRLATVSVSESTSTNMPVLRSAPSYHMLSLSVIFMACCDRRQACMVLSCLCLAHNVSA